MSEKAPMFDPHQLYTDQFILKDLTSMSEDEVRAKATEYKRAERFADLLPRQEEERERLFGHFVFELAMKTREREMLERAIKVDAA